MVIYATVKADKMVLLSQRIRDEIRRLEAGRDELHYYAGHQFDSACNSQIAGLNWVLATMANL
jgi:hypothetical protein